MLIWVVFSFVGGFIVVSILYWRCQRLDTGVEFYMPTRFNSLLEMLVMMEAGDGWALRMFQFSIGDADAGVWVKG